MQALTLLFLASMIITLWIICALSLSVLRPLLRSSRREEAQTSSAPSAPSAVKEPVFRDSHFGNLLMQHLIRTTIARAPRNPDGTIKLHTL